MPDIELTIRGKNLADKALNELKRKVEETAKALEDAGDSVEVVEKKTEKAKGAFGGLLAVLGGVSLAFGLQSRSMLQAGAGMDRIERSLLAVSGSAAKAQREFGQLREVAKLPGLGLQEAVMGSVNLQSVGFSAELAKRSLMAFGNALATVGRGREELQGVILAMTQIKAKGKVMGQEILQLGERLPQIRKAMQAAFGTASTEELAQMGLTADKFLEGVVTQLEKLPKVTGGSANAMENFKDALFIMRAELARGVLPTLTKGLEAVSAFILKVSEASPALRNFLSISLLTTTGLSSLAVAIGGVAMAVPHVKTGVLALGKAFIWLGANPIVLVTAALAALVAGLYVYNRMQKSTILDMSRLTKSFDQATASANKLATAEELTRFLDELADKSKLTTEEEKKLKAIKDELIQLSPSFVASMTDETKSLKEQANSAKAVLVDMRRYSSERRALAVAEAKLTYKTVMSDLSGKQEHADKLRGEIDNLQTALRNAQTNPSKHKPTDVWQESLQFKQGSLGKLLNEMDELQAKKNQALDTYQILQGLKPQANTSTDTNKPEGYKTTDEQIKAANDVAMAKAEAIEDDLNKTLEVERLKVAQAEESAKRQKDLLKVDIAGEDAYAAEIRRIDNELAAVKIRSATAVSEARKKAADEALKLAEEEQEAYLKASEKDLDRYKKAEEEKKDAKKQALEDTYKSEMAGNALILKEFDKQRADAYTTYRYRSALLQMQLNDAKANAKDTGRIEAEMNQERLAWIASNKKIDVDQAKDAAEKKMDIADREAEAEIAYMRYIASITTNEHDKKIADAKADARETEYSLKKTLADSKATEKEKAVAKEQLARVSIDLANVVANIEQDRAEETAEELKKMQDKAKDALKDANEKQREEEQKTFSEYVNHRSMQIDLMEEGLAKELAGLSLKYEQERGEIKDILKWEDLSAERRKYLEEQLGMIERRQGQARIASMLEYYGVIGHVAVSLASMPGDLIRLFTQSSALASQAGDDISELEQQRLADIRKVRAEEEMTAAEKAREIERIEQESADRRLEIERELTEKRGQLFSDYFKGFFMGILEEIEKIIQEKLAKGITRKIGDVLLSQLGEGGSSGTEQKSPWLDILSSIVKVGGRVAAAYFSGGTSEIAASVVPFDGPTAGFEGFDNPAHDRMAFNRGMSMLVGASYDDPINDARARLKGTQQSARRLGQRSAKDMLDNFVAGFNRSAELTGAGGNNTELLNAIKDMKFNLYLDGRQIQATVMNREDRDRALGNGR